MIPQTGNVRTTGNPAAGWESGCNAMWLQLCGGTRPIAPEHVQPVPSLCATGHLQCQLETPAPPRHCTALRVQEGLKSVGCMERCISHPPALRGHKSPCPGANGLVDGKPFIDSHETQTWPKACIHASLI